MTDKVKHEMDFIDERRYQAFKIIKEQKMYSWRELHQIYAPRENFSTFYLKCKNLKTDRSITNLEYYDRPYYGKNGESSFKRRKKNVLLIKQEIEKQISDIENEIRQIHSNTKEMV